MTDKQIKEINEQIKKAIQRIENLQEKYKAKEQECNQAMGCIGGIEQWLKKECE